MAMITHRIDSDREGMHVMAKENRASKPATSVQPPPLARFDAAAAWSSLTPIQQAQIGVAAIVHTLGAIGASLNMDPPQGWQAADTEGLAALELAAMDLLPDAFEPEPLLPSLAPIGVRSCMVCGCSDECACPGGCSWVAPGLCSACVPTVAAAADALPPALRDFIRSPRGLAADDDPDLAAAVQAGLASIYSGAGGRAAYQLTDYAKLLRDAEGIAGLIGGAGA